jgi:type II secretory pathway predicted ATPase ExeA
MRDKYPHLNKDARRIMTASVEKRIRYIQQDRFILSRSLSKILDLVDNWVKRPAGIRPPCLALVGDSGSGKSTLIDEIQRRYRRATDPNVRKVIYCQLDPLPELRVSQRMLLTALGIPPTLSVHETRVHGDDLISRSLQEQRTRIVIFDEMDHMKHLPRREHSLQWDWLKWVSTLNRVSVVCVGVPGYEQTIRHDGQLETRFRIMQLPRWTVGPSFSQFLTAYEQSLPLRRPSGLGATVMQSALLRESQLKVQIAGVTEGIRQIIEEAAIAAIHCGEERINLSLLSAWREGLEPDPGPRKKRAPVSGQSPMTGSRDRSARRP